jgi:hypothetical protein
MQGKLFWISAVAIASFVCWVSASQNETVIERNGKGKYNFNSFLKISFCLAAAARGRFFFTVFSLFSIVQFKNTGCRSQSAMTSGQR